jgi:hypothetical protein
VIPVSPCDYIPQSQIIATAKMRLELSTANYDGYFRIELENALKKFYTPSIYHEQCKLVDICDNSIKIPAGCRKILGLQFCTQQVTTSDDEETGGIFAVPIGNFYIWNGLIPQYPAYGNCTVENYFTYQDGYLYANRDTDETLAMVWYVGYKTDDDGLIMIPDYFESCLANYLGYCFLKKKPTWLSNNVYATREARELYRRDYIAEKKQIIGSDQVEQFDDQKLALRFAQNKMRLNNYSWAPFFSGYYSN